MTTKPTTGDRFGLLADERRRRVLAHLRRRPDGVSSVEELAEHLLDADGAAPETGETSGRIETSLHHKHLPKMVEAGVLEYDTRSRTVRYEPDEEVEELLDVALGAGAVPL